MLFLYPESYHCPWHMHWGFNFIGPLLSWRVLSWVRVSRGRKFCITVVKYAKGPGLVYFIFGNIISPATQWWQHGREPVSELEPSLIRCVYFGGCVKSSCWLYWHETVIYSNYSVLYRCFYNLGLPLFSFGTARQTSKQSRLRCSCLY